MTWPGEVSYSQPHAPDAVYFSPFFFHLAYGPFSMMRARADQTQPMWKPVHCSTKSTCRVPIAALSDLKLTSSISHCALLQYFVYHMVSTHKWLFIHSYFIWMHLTVLQSLVSVRTRSLDASGKTWSISPMANTNNMLSIETLHCHKCVPCISIARRIKCNFKTKRIQMPVPVVIVIPAHRCT